MDVALTYEELVTIRSALATYRSVVLSLGRGEEKAKQEYDESGKLLVRLGEVMSGGSHE